MCSQGVWKLFGDCLVGVWKYTLVYIHVLTWADVSIGAAVFKFANPVKLKDFMDNFSTRCV